MEALLTTNSLFPFFMLIAFEGGSLLRALILLLLYPVVFLCGENDDQSFRLMVFISFAGLRKKDVENVSKAVLHKFYLENLNLKCYEVLASTEKRTVVSRMPKVMIETFLREFLEVDEILGSEVCMYKDCLYTGFTCFGGQKLHRKSLFGGERADVGIISYHQLHHHHHDLISRCKELFIVTREDKGPSSKTPRNKYPKPLIFHDGRLAFLPTPFNALSLFLYLPLGITVALARMLLGSVLPFQGSMVSAPFLGFRYRATDPPRKSTKGGVLFVCNHKTLIDPVMFTGGINRHVSAVAYSISPFSELISPIKMVRLTRNRTTDAAKIHALLKEGDDVVVCPEGTTCREPYLLRFSALFAELTDDIMPVAIDARVDMFYGTTASGFKWLDPIFFMMNRRPEYDLQFLGKWPKEFTCAGGVDPKEVANMIQKHLADVLGFECTRLTRKDKYLVLAGNEGKTEK